MSPVLLTGVVTVNLALVFYTAGFAVEQRRRRVTPLVLASLTIAASLDIVATACMMIVSRQPWFTPHGLLGFSALAGMLAAVALAWRCRGRGGDTAVPRGLHVLLRLAYVWWVFAYLAGATMAMRR